MTASPPLIVQQDGRLLLDARARVARSVADALRRFAELEKCPGDHHIYRLTRHSLWNAAAGGITADRILDYLRRAAGAPPPPAVERLVRREIGRYGRLRLTRGPHGGDLLLVCDDPRLLAELAAPLDLGDRLTAEGLAVPAGRRGWLKHRLAQLGHPVRDEVGYADGAPLAVAWRPGTRLRPYQQEALTALLSDERRATSDEGNGATGRSGLVLLPCGAGKTLVGVGATVALGRATLVLCPNATAVRQWAEAYAAFTTLPREAIAEYGPRRRQVRPVTVTTYQMLTARRSRRGSGEDGFAAPLPHLALAMNHDWGLIVYDEAHLLPADVFRLTAEVQSRRRLGLTATPVREDGRETELFALVGPVLYSAPWGRLEEEGWIAPASCVEVRVPVGPEGATDGGATLSHREAASAGAKWPVVRAILGRHRGEPALVIGQYLDQLRELAARLEAPLVAGDTLAAERERVFARFRAGREPVLVLSRVGNAALDLPNAAVAIEVSGNFGSRQEEAQRLGRVLRPKGGRPAHFYALVTEGSVERAYAERRRRFLVEQGYEYRIVQARALLGRSAPPSP